MQFQVREEPIAALAELAGVCIAFEVRRILEVTRRDASPDQFTLRERDLKIPYTKDYDAIAGEGPLHWARRFDVSKWGLLVCRAGGRCVGGAVIALDTPGLTMLAGRRDLAILWDLRVAPKHRREGIGTALFQAAEAWAAAKGCRQLDVETQNVNLPACRFYERQGCRLSSVRPQAYPELPAEVQLIWSKVL